MFGTDEFGNNRLLPVTFMVLFAVLSCGAVVTSQTMWDGPAAVAAGIGN